jgi:hypothetical protein
LGVKISKHFFRPDIGYVIGITLKRIRYGLKIFASGLLIKGAHGVNMPEQGGIINKNSNKDVKILAQNCFYCLSWGYYTAIGA